MKLELWKDNRGYTFLKPYIDWCTRQSYRELRYRGADLPDEGAVIIAPNHTNTLMDALVILNGRKAPTAFGARADIFRKPSIARILHFLRILPMVRQRDGLEHVSENYESFDAIDDILEHNVPFCLFPEGAHRPERGLQPIKKGIARLALRSAGERHTWVVPTGINHADFFRYRCASEVRYGKPIDVNAFVREHADMQEAQLLQALRTHIEENMSAMVDDKGPKTDKVHPLLWALWPFAAFLSLPLWCTAEILCRKVKDKAWCNTIRCLCLIFLLPPTVLIWGIIFGFTLPWYATLALLGSLPASYGLFYDCLNRLHK